MHSSSNSKSVSSRVKLYLRRFPTFSVFGALRNTKAGSQDPFGENEEQPLDSQFYEPSTLYGNCGLDEQGIAHAGDDALDGIWSSREHVWASRAASPSLDSELKEQGWDPTSIALEAGPETASSLGKLSPSPASFSAAPPPSISYEPAVDRLQTYDAPLPFVSDDSLLNQLGRPNNVNAPKRKRSIENAAGCAGRTGAAQGTKKEKKRKTARKVEQDKRWFEEGKAKRRQRRQKNAERRKMVSTDPPSANDPLPPHTSHSNPSRPRPSTSEKYGSPSVLILDHPIIDNPKANLRNYSTAPGWICNAKKGKGEERKVPTLEEMIARGFQVVSFPECERLVALDQQEKIMVALTGYPNDAAWRKIVSNCGKAMGEAGDISEATPTHGSRGDITVLHAGCTHYMGTQKPSNRSLGSASYHKAVQLLQNNADIKRVAALQSALLGFYAPKEALYYDVTLDKLYDHDRTLRRPFEKSIYPSVAFNVDPNTATLDHTDAGNYPVNLCAITAFGNYDHRRGGHIILYDLKLVVEFPVGYTFLIPSGAMRHGNTAIAQGETRYSMVQYCPGGLLRWVEHGFQNEADYRRKGGKEVDADERWAQVLNKLSRLSELVEDHRLYRGGQKRGSAQRADQA